MTNDPIDNINSVNSERGCNCPLAKIPENVWTALFKKPFRKRHPWLFWLGIIVAISLVGSIINMYFDDKEANPDDDCIALVSVQGAILDPRGTLDWVRKIEGMSSVKGILLRVNSPGGGAAASQEIYSALKRISKKKPIAVSMGAAAASGGFMISMAGERIFANPSTITGSIGVRMDIPQLQGLMEKIGVGQETLVTGPYKDAASYTHPLSQKDREYLENVLDNMHMQFVEIIAQNRKLPIERVKELANGKIYTGQQALELNLIDEMGGQEEAHMWLADKLKLPYSRKLYVKPKEKMRALDVIFSSAKSVVTILENLGKLNEGIDSLNLTNLKYNNQQPAFYF